MRRALAAMLVALSSCTGGADVVARIADAGSESAAAFKDANSAVIENACRAPVSPTAVLTKLGDVHLFNSSLKEVSSVLPSCAEPASSPASLAVDRGGMVWLANGGRLSAIDPQTGSCKATPLAFSVKAMAFVWNPKSGREALYAIIATSLVAVDTATLTTTPIGELTPALGDVRGLAGTVDGWLLAFAGDPLVTIAYVDTTSAAVKTISQVKSPGPMRAFAGGVPSSQGFELVFGVNAWSFNSTTGMTVLQTPLFGDDPGIVAVSSSPCAMLGN